MSPAKRRGRPARLIAHRGDSASCPENTAAAFDAAIAAGADAIELDLRLCKDGVVVCHDPSLARFGGSRRALRQQLRSELACADAGSWLHKRYADQGLLDLDTLLMRYAKRTELLLELKPGTQGADRAMLVAMVLTALDRYNLADVVRILCFDEEILGMLASEDPELRLVRNITRPPRRLGPWLAGQPRLSALDVDHRYLRSGLAEECHEHGLELYCWSCNTALEVGHALTCGVDGVLTDRPRWLAERWRQVGAPR